MVLATTGTERLEPPPGGARRRSSLVDAAFARLGDDRWRDTTIGALCVDAGLNKRDFYESFPDLDAVEHAVISGLAEELAAVGMEAASAALLRRLDTDHLAHDVLGQCIDGRVELSYDVFVAEIARTWVTVAESAVARAGEG